jgi:hypothetical protein
VSGAWTNPTTVSVLAQPMLATTICPDGPVGHQGTSADMIPVNPKDLVVTPSPMDVDPFMYRSNQMTQSLHH